MTFAIFKEILINRNYKLLSTFAIKMMPSKDKTL